MSPPEGPLDDLSPEERRRLLKARLARREARAPVSLAQERLLFLDQLGVGPHYNVARCWRLMGPLDEQALGSSLAEIVRRHAVLRSRFERGGDPPLQVVEEQGPVLGVEDLGSVPAREREAEARRRVEAWATAPFALERGPLLRPVLVRLGGDESLLLLSVHHAVFDGWSFGVFERELESLYGAFSEGRESSLAALDVQYADHARWQRKALAGEALVPHLEYWRERLAGAPSLDLPTDGRRTPGAGARGARVRAGVSASVVGKLKAFALEERASLYMVLLAAFDVLLSRYARQDDVVVGTPVAGRNRAETRDLIGLFVNTLVMRVDLSGDPSTRQLLRRVREAALGAFQHQDAPFDQIVRELRLPPDPGRNPLYDVMFALQDGSQQGLALPNLRVDEVETDFVPLHADIEVQALERRGELSLEFRYDSGLFLEPTIERLSRHYVNLLQAAVSDPEAPISTMPMLDEQDRAELLAWNQTDRTYPEARCLHELFEAQVRRTPDATALVFEGEQLSYSELDARADRLAAHLRTLGVGPNRLVGVFAERSLELVVGLFGVLKAGGAYVPLDPSYPPQRIQNMIEDAQTPVILSQTRLADRLPDSDARVVLLDGEEWGGDVGADGSEAAAGPGDLAYVIFTSGSTGRPKGAMISHRAIHNRLFWMQEAYGLGPGDKVLQKTPASFDVSVWEFFWPLMTGACLVMARPEGHKDPAYLVETIAAHGITTMHFVPPMLRVFLEAEGLDRCDSLRRVICSGEALPPDLVQLFHERMACELHNLYGPTEAAVDVTAFPCPRGERLTVVPIGKPIANTRIHLLDRHGEPVPAGVAGELYIGGVQVGEGYLGRPELTAERFVPDPFDPSPGARLYRTGDLARYLPDGNIEYLGRLDHQVKVRGFRIELGEIEAAMLECPGVSAVAVITREDDGDRRLVGFVVPEAGVDVSHEELRRWLAEQLPEHMVPSAFVTLDELPLTPNGKVDRKKLQGFEVEFGTARAAYEAPRTPYEEALAEIFQELLSVERVGIHDSFFQLGGHSLLGTRLAARIRALFDVEIPLGELFKRPSVAALAASVAERRRTGGATPSLPLQPVSRQGPLPASLGQQRLWLMDQLGTGAAYNIPLALRMRGRLDGDGLGRALDALAARHETLRTRFGLDDGELFQIVAESAPVPLERVDRSDIDPEGRLPELQALVAELTAQAFDLTRCPLLRAALVRFADDDHALVLVVHHTVADGWSLQVIARDLAALYRGAVGGEEQALEPLALQFADIAAWQRQVLSEGAVADMLASWSRELGGELPDLELLTDRPRPATQTFEGDTCVFELDGAAAADVQGFARAHGATVAMVCLAAWQALLARYTGQDRIVVGSPSAGRRRAESEPVVGFFVNMLVLPLDVSGDPPFAELLERAKAVSLAAIDHEELPFETLVDALDPARDPSRAPLFQVTFSLQQELAVELDVPGLDWEVVTTRARKARFDLELHLVHGEHGLTGRLIYNTDLFDAHTIDRMVGHYRRLLAAAVAAPGTPLSALPLLTEGEQRRLVSEWNETATDYPRDATVPELFEQQAAWRPEAPALSFGPRTLTYGELSRRSDALAGRLREHGVGPGVFVGVRLERDIEFIVALLGVLKAGGAYVPLDPEYPPRRVAYMLADTGAPVLLTQSSLRDDLPPYEGTVLLLDPTPVDDGEVSAGDGGTQRAAAAGAASATDLAYVIYTSGSTGEPKGVCVPHRAIVRLVRDTDYVDLGPDDRIGQASITSFDAATFEIWGALLNGGCLVGVPKDVALDPERMGDHLRRERIDTLFVTTALFNQLVSRRPDTFGSLRDLLFGGEAVDPRWVATALEQGAPRRLLHVYGPTENTTFSTWYDVRAVPEGARTVPIGRPIANTTAHVLDRQGRPVPVGVPGELYLGGDGLADGYLGAPEMTAARWVERRPDGHTPERLYRTGDRVRRLESGDIEFLSRMDQQVKVRGHRIEPGEVELALLASPAVDEAVVIVREDTPGDKRLVGYVVAAEGADVSPAALRSFLREALPAYMIPTAFVALDELPLNPNGKVDKAALPAPHDRQVEGEAVAPRTETESRIAAVWRELLGVDAVSVHDDFFELGGHSLLGMQMISRLRDEFGLGLPLQLLFDEPTVAGLGAGLEAAMAVQQDGGDSEEEDDRVEIDF